MVKYIVLYRASQSAMEATANMTPEEMKKGMEAWMTWVQSCGDSLLDIGTPLGDGRRMTRETNSPSESDVIGYSILEAESMDAAQALLADHPHLEWAPGCEIEVHEVMPMPDMSGSQPA